jgi:hypothetical protein
MKKYKFDKNRKNASHCHCGKSNEDGKFCPLIDDTTSGYCHSCNQMFLPDSPKPERSPDVVEQPVKKLFSNIPVEFLDTFSGIVFPNNYTDYLFRIYGREVGEALIERYLIGSYNQWNGASIFWQVDHRCKVRTGKIMLYDRQTGKRIKKPISYIDWVHNKMVQQGLYQEYLLQQCLFGQHLLVVSDERNKTVGIVESEATAIEMNYYHPDLIWLATGGAAANALMQTDTQKILSERKVILFPDGGKYQQWLSIKEKLKFIGLDIEISSTIEELALDEPETYSNYDMRDLYRNHV